MLTLPFGRSVMVPTHVAGILWILSYFSAGSDATNPYSAQF
jgi:hypothetical protein